MGSIGCRPFVDTISRFLQIFTALQEHEIVSVTHNKNLGLKKESFMGGKFI